MSEYFNHPPYELETSGEVRADFHLASEDLRTLEEGRQLVEARRQVEQAQAKEVVITERDVALSIGRGLRKARRWKAGTEVTQKDLELAGGE